MINLNFKEVHDGVFKTSYKGVPIQKFPFDYLIYQMIIHEVRPDLIIEIGTMYGGSALYFADLMHTMGIKGGEVHTIDIIDLETRKDEMSIDFPLKETDNYPKIIYSNPRIKTFLGGFKDYDLDNCKKFNRILVIDDGSHIYEDVMDSLNKFKDVVGIGSYFIVEDGNALDVDYMDETFKPSLNGGPIRSIFEFLNESNGFNVDLKWCDMFGINSTFNTYGYLKKMA